MSGIARLRVVAIDCPDPGELARFYGAITGWPVDDEHTDADWLELRSPDGVTVAFQLAEEYSPPVWPGAEHPQQMHLDFDVEDLDVGEAKVLAQGARKAEVQPGETFRVFIDPAGHPFCLVLDRALR